MAKKRPPHLDVAYQKIYLIHRLGADKPEVITSPGRTDFFYLNWRYGRLCKKNVKRALTARVTAATSSGAPISMEDGTICYPLSIHVDLLSYKRLD